MTVHLDDAPFDPVSTILSRRVLHDPSAPPLFRLSGTRPGNRWPAAAARGSRSRSRPPAPATGRGARRKPPPERIDRVIDVPCRTCPDCTVALIDPSVVVQYQTDLPPIVPVVTQFNIETGYCPCCRQYHRGRRQHLRPRRAHHGRRTQTPARRSLSQNL